MKSKFITIQLDRLKYSDLNTLYRSIQEIILRQDAGSMHLSVPFTRFCGLTAQLACLETKVRTKYNRADYTKHLKRLDELVSALLLHLKALKRADFPEFRVEVNEVNRLVRKEMSNFVHVGVDNKKAALDIILMYFDPASKSWYEAAAKPGLSRYFEELRLTREKMDSIENDEKVLKKEQASSVEAIKAKAELIKELRILLQCIDVTVLSYPDVDYTSLIALINYELKEHRTQLRNLQTRRIKKKEKELNQE